MLLVARPYLEGFVEGWCEVSTPFPFVLLVVNGGDAPLTEGLQRQCRTRKGSFFFRAFSLMVSILDGAKLQSMLHHP